MFFICFCLRVANGTTEYGVIPRRGMAVGALVPFPLVFSAVDRKIHLVVIKGSRRPGRFAVAAGAVGRKLCGFMVGIGGLVIVGNMAAGAGIWRVGVITVVAGGAVVGYSCMRPFQNIIIVVNRKSSRLPRGGGMTRRAIRWNIQGNVVRVGTLVVILRMAGCAIRRRTGISRGMTGRAGRCYMRTGQGETGFAVIEPIVSFPCRVAGQTGRTAVRIAVHAIVVIISFRIGVAGGTGKFRVIRRIGMAIQALLPFTLVFPAVDREKIRVVLGVFRRHPVQIRRVALYTVL